VNLLADESIDQPIVKRLRDRGHRVWYVAEMDSGISDDMVLDLANRHEALLLTADKDFGELVFRQKRFTPGVLLIRLAGLSSARKADLVALAVDEHQTELTQAFAVIEPGYIRIRRQYD
jgi:predicted nuclease of predicted toxin-antitoxin system